MMTAEEIGRLVEQRLQPGESYKSLAEKLVRELRRNRQAYEDPGPAHANRLPAAYVRPSVLHRGRRQGPGRHGRNPAQEVARREKQAWNLEQKRLLRAEMAAKRERQMRKILNFGKPGGLAP